ncbi:hypothetical protein [Brevundimonas sp.]|uniref:hypothetical protein n=1 Tax=Brevundimonas sp. TaxID=1871086 RepID=UPI0028978D6A|nr:hypothetical protein [Brevundimonas sp.]
MTRPAPTVTVPVEPTPEMLRAGFHADNLATAWALMLAAAPAAPQAAVVGKRDYPAEFEAWWATYRHRNRDVADYSVKKQIAFDAFYYASLRAPSGEPEGGAVLFEVLPDEIDLFRIMRAAGRTNAEKARAVAAHLPALATREEAPAEAGEDDGLFLLMKRDLYYRPNAMGYTGIKDHAGRYTKAEAESHADALSGVTAIAAIDAPDFSPACFDDLARAHLAGKLEQATRELSALRAQPSARDNRICRICDGGPGNEGVCLCGEEAWEQPQAREDAQRVPFVVGNQYRTQGGDMVRFVSVHRAGTSYETMADEDGVHRYTMRDFGRVTGTDHDYSDPRNTPPLYARPAPDALRVAVEALEAAREVLPVRSSRSRNVEARAKIDQALAALQAEQKGGA